MTKIIKINYAFIDNYQMFYEIYLYSDVTVKYLLRIISKEKKYITLFHKQSKTDPNDLIYDYWKIDPQYIFIASTNFNPPSTEFEQSLLSINQCYISTLNPKNNSIKVFHFFTTGIDKEMLFNGIDVELSTAMNSEDCSKYFLNLIKDKTSIENKKMIIYFAGGIPFTSGTLEDFYSNDFFNFKNNIYGVLINDISNELLNVHLSERINLNNTIQRQLISQLCNSSDQGLCDMACLLEYFHHGNRNLLFFQYISTCVINFPPFIISLNNIINYGRIADKNNDTVRDIVTIYFQHYLHFSEVFFHFNAKTVAFLNMVLNYVI